MAKIDVDPETGLAFLSTGVCGGCAECRSDNGYSEDDSEDFSAAVENGDIPDEGHFSWSACDLCNSTLGGDRYAAHGRDENGDLVHLDICVDCLMQINA